MTKLDPTAVLAEERRILAGVEDGSNEIRVGLIDRDSLISRLSDLLGLPCKLLSVRTLDRGSRNEHALSGIRILDVRFDDGSQRKLVFRTMNPGPFGLEEREDRARHLLYCYRTFNRVPGHARALDVGALGPSGKLCTLAEVGEFYLLEEFLEGRIYGDEFSAMRTSCSTDARHVAIAKILANYLAVLHRGETTHDTIRYRRALRDLIGGGDGLIGLVDGYPSAFISRNRQVLDQLEVTCLSAVQRLRQRSWRLRPTHGDFHPWNILLKNGIELNTIDKSRADRNDPAIDVGSMLMNYMMLAIWQRASGSALHETPGLVLGKAFLQCYLTASDDREILEVLPPFTAMRSAAVASPIFYPEMPETLRLRALEAGIMLAGLPALDENLSSFERFLAASGDVL